MPTRPERVLKRPNDQALTQSSLRAKVRRQRAAPVLQPQGVSYLESRSVRGPTILDYQRRCTEFVAWCRQHQLDWVGPILLDELVTVRLDDLFFQGLSKEHGTHLVAAVMFFIPDVSRLGDHGLPRSKRALKGWNLASPAQQRLPMPVEVLGAVMGLLIRYGHRQVSIKLFLSFICYLRPGEADDLLVNQLVPPSAAMSTSRCWTLLLHPVERGVPGKTSIFDASVLIDGEGWLHPFLNELILGREPTERLWEQSHAETVEIFSTAIRQLKLEPLGTCLYALRHGGASHDLLHRRRPLEEIKKRGRWVTDSSLRRYAKEARLNAEVSKIALPVLEFGRQVIDNLPGILGGSASLPPLPR
jgi:hypothetical protein